MKNIAVIKFGGSSLDNSQKILFAANRTKNFLKYYKKIALVLSAPSDITDDLIKLSRNFKSDKRSLDMLVSCGENISISLMNMALNSIKVKSIALNQYQARILTTSDENKNDIKYLDFKKIKNLFNEYDIVIVPGFIGINKNMEITTLGRGGSDYTAVYISYHLKADCYLLSDIKGVYSSNPSKIDYAKKLKEISYDELYEISKVESEIRQTKAMIYAKRKNISIYLGSSVENTSPTLIKNYNTREKPKIKYISVNKDNRKTLIIMIGENIINRKDIISKLNKIKNSDIKVEKNRISLIISECLSDKDIKKIYSKFINR